MAMGNGFGLARAISLLVMDRRRNKKKKARRRRLLLSSAALPHTHTNIDSISWQRQRQQQCPRVVHFSLFLSFFLFKEEENAPSSVATRKGAIEKKKKKKKRRRHLYTADIDTPSTTTLPQLHHCTATSAHSDQEKRERKRERE
jgi:hypothetical protein